MKTRASLLCLALATACLLSGTFASEKPATDASADVSADPPATNAPRSFRAGAKPQQFQAEVTRLMEILVRNLYSNEDIFLRELISNAADALDKVRFVSLTNASALGSPKAAAIPMEIRISADKERNVLSIRDTGIGMTRHDLVNNLGTIARSGTAAFLENAQKGGDLNLIGQFGVGFYSAYLVADYVEVTTKHADDVQMVWESSSEGSYAISEDTEGEALERGTRIDLYLKDSAKGYLEEYKLRELVQRYSEFINFPISLLVEKTVEKEVPVEEDDEVADDATADTEKDADDAVVVEEEEEDADSSDEEKKPKTKKITETTQEWQILNDAKALWLRPPGNVSDEEHVGFYQVLSKNPLDKPLAHTHFRAEGDMEFKAVLYIPTTPPEKYFENYHKIKARVKLYVRRVFISDTFEELLPHWLNFIVALVDSDDMPLNVSRETLQMSQNLKVIRKKLVRKAIDMMKKLSDAAEKQEDGDNDGDAAEKKTSGWFGKKKSGDKEDSASAAAAAATKLEEDKNKYADFWKTFGKPIKMGLIDDATNRRRLLPLLRFKTTASVNNDTTLDAYISRMAENQTAIYYLVGTGPVEDMAKSPFVEAVTAAGMEVILFNEAIDEYVMGHVQEYKGKGFINVSKDDLKLPTSEDDKAKEKQANAAYKDLAAWWKAAINDTNIIKVKVSRRLASAPCIVVSDRFGWTAAMERIAQAQAMTSGKDEVYAAFAKGRRTLEINPRHPLVRRMREKYEEDKDSTALALNARVLYESCLLDSGFLLDDPKPMTKRIQELLAETMGVDGGLEPLAEEEYPDVEEMTAEEEVIAAAKAAAAAESEAKESEAAAEEVEEEVEVDAASTVKDEL